MSAPDPLASFRLDDRLIIVTGASAGLGRTFAEAFARLGARVVLAARRRDQLAQVARGILEAGGRAELVPTDILRLGDIQALADAVASLAGERDRIVLVNNAGLGFTKPALEVTEAEWDDLIDLHVKGTFFCSQRIGALMLARGYGKIFNLSSAWAAASVVEKSV
jgi:NAD(P)-dependent dehydrogenase (short-subunit alcohol dehydrogenase family)